VSLVSVTRPDGSTTMVESNDQVVVFAVDAQGWPLGLRPLPLAPGLVQVPSEPPPGGHWRWAGEWVREVPLGEAIEIALQRIDQAAGAQRLMYITDVPGQAATYLLKQEQALAFLGAPLGPVPPFVQAEADAMATTPLLAAQYIAQTAAAWTNLAPLIERERRRGKVAVEAATSTEAVQAALEAALAAIDQI
jgi:hypothetical protein